MVYFLCRMYEQLELIEHELTQRIYKLFLVKFDGNKSAFARAANCTEGTVRRVLRNEQGITINLLLRLANALDVKIVELLDGIDLQNLNSK